MRSKFGWVAIISILFSHSLLAQNGNAYVIVRDLPPSRLITEMLQNFMKEGMSIESSTETQLLCSKPMDSSLKSIFLRALTTPRYSTNPVYKYRTTVAKNGSDTTISVEMYFEYQNAFGQMTRTPITHKGENEKLRAGLEQLKRNWESRQIGSVSDSATNPSAKGVDKREFDFPEAGDRLATGWRQQQQFLTSQI